MAGGHRRGGLLGHQLHAGRPGLAWAQQAQKAQPARAGHMPAAAGRPACWHKAAGGSTLARPLSAPTPPAQHPASHQPPHLLPLLLCFLLGLGLVLPLPLLFLLPQQQRSGLLRLALHRQSRHSSTHGGRDSGTHGPSGLAGQQRSPHGGGTAAPWGGAGRWRHGQAVRGGGACGCVSSRPAARRPHQPLGRGQPASSEGPAPQGLPSSHAPSGHAAPRSSLPAMLPPRSSLPGRPPRGSLPAMLPAI